MFIVREVMNCRPGKVRGLVDRFLAMKKLTIVAEFEVESLEA
jgi:hypothetical protein